MGRNHHKPYLIPAGPREEPTGQFKFSSEKPAYYKERPVFAFNFYLDDDKNWSFRCISDCRKFHTLFRNLKHMSSLTWGEIKSGNQFHAHDIEWEHKSLPDIVRRLSKDKGLEELPLFQFKAFDESRIVGIFNLRAVFEIICIDKAHKIFPEA